MSTQARQRPACTRPGRIYEVQIAGAPAHLTITRMPDGRPGEVFIQGGTGSAFAGYLARRLAHDYLNAGERAELGLTGR